MNEQRMKSNIMLLSTAAIWGFAFVSQRIAANYLGAFAFNGIRFALGCLSLLPLLIYNMKKSENKNTLINKNVIFSGIIAGSVLFAGAGLQQLGMNTTTAGKAAFITGLYIVLVPIIGIFLKHRIGANVWVAALLAVSGLYFLSINENFSISQGDAYELIGAFFWATHILLIDNLTKKMDPIQISFVQFAACSILSLIVSGFTEKTTLDLVFQASTMLFYSGVCSVGIAYTLQVVAQKHAKPSHAALILSMETVFASIGGFLILGEKLSPRGILGCFLMLSGILISQLQFPERKKVKDSIYLAKK